MAHQKLDILQEKGFVILKPYENEYGPLDPQEWESLEYMDWKSGGDTNFAPLASANGEMDGSGFWDHGKPDKDGIWIPSQVEKTPTLKRWVEANKARIGRVRIIKLQPNTYEAVAARYMHQDDNNRLNPDGEGYVVRAWLNLTDNPDSYMVVREVRDDPSTESHIPLPRGAQFVVDTERLWHAVYHPGDAPRYALITSWESGPELQRWIDERLPSAVGAAS